MAPLKTVSAETEESTGGMQGGHPHETAAVISRAYVAPSEEETEIGVAVRRQGDRQRSVFEP